MEMLPPTLQELLLTEFHISKNRRDPTLKGLILVCAHGEARFLLTRQQLLALGEACHKAAEPMPKPS